MLHLNIIPSTLRCIVLTSGSFILLTRQKAVQNLSRNTLIPALNQKIHSKSAIPPCNMAGLSKYLVLLSLGTGSARFLGLKHY